MVHMIGLEWLDLYMDNFENFSDFWTGIHSRLSYMSFLLASGSHNWCCKNNTKADIDE